MILGSRFGNFQPGVSVFVTCALALVFLKLLSCFEAFDVELLGCDSKFDIKVWMHVCSNPYDVI